MDDIGQVADLADTLPLVLPYPMHDGLLWTARDSTGGTTVSLDKLVEGWETIATPAGSFGCWRIRRIYGAPLGGVESYEYVSEQGLVRRRAELQSSSGVYRDTYNLISFTLY
jgi:hypothetical protein